MSCNILPTNPKGGDSKLVGKLLKNGYNKDQILSMYKESISTYGDWYSFNKSRFFDFNKIKKKYRLVNSDGTSKRLTITDGNYKILLNKVALLNEDLKKDNLLYSARIVKVRGEKGDHRIYYSIEIKPDIKLTNENNLNYVSHITDSNGEILYDKIVPANDLSVDLKKEYKFTKVIQDRSLLKKELSSEITKARQRKDETRALLLTEKLKVIQEDIKTLKEVDEYKYVTDLMKRDFNDFNKILNKGEINTGDLLIGIRATDFWSNASELFFEEEDKELYEKSYKEVIELQNEARELNEKFSSLALDNLYKFQKNAFNTDLTKESFEELLSNQRDISSSSSLGRDISMSNDILLNSVSKAVRDQDNLVRQELDNLIDKVGELSKGIPKDIFSAMVNPETGHLRTKIKDAYYKEFDKFRYQLENTTDEKAQAIIEDNKKRFIKENSMLFDVRKLMDTSKYHNEELYLKELYSGVSQFSDTQKNEHTSELISLIGEKQFEKYQKGLEEKANKLKQDREDYKTFLINEKDLTNEELQKEMIEWELSHSPVFWVSFVNDQVVKYKPSGKQEGYKYTYSVPSKEEWYDSEFSKIENNLKALEFYNFFVETNNQLKKYLPYHLQDEIKFNTIPAIERTIAEKYSTKGMKAGSAPILDFLKKEISANSESPYDYSSKDFEGKEIRNVQIPLLNNHKKMFNDIMKIKKAKFIINNNRQPDKLEYLKLEKETNIELTSKKSLDLPKVLKLFAGSVIDYKHRSAVENEIDLVKYHFDNAQEKEVVKINGLTIGKTKSVEGVDVDDIKKAKEDSYKNTKASLDSYIKSFKKISKDKEFRTNTKVYTEEENKRLKEIDELLKGDISEEQRDALTTERGLIGSFVVGSMVGDQILKWVQLKGMGWNILSGFSNLSFGFISNLIESQGGRFYDQDQFYKALWLTKSTLGSQLTLNTYKSQNAKKIDAFMKHFDVLKDSSDELYKTSNEFTEKMKFLGPYNITKQTEYLNQAPVMIAMMMNTGLNGKKLTEGEPSLWDELSLESLSKFEVGSEGYNTFKARIDDVIKRNHGNYDPLSPLRIKDKLWGRALTQFRTWALEGFASRFESRKPSYIHEDETLGRYRSYYNYFEQNGFGKGVLTLMKHYAMTPLTMTGISKNKAFEELNGLSEVDIQNMKKNIGELFILTNLFLLTLMIKAGLEEDEDKKAFYTFLINQGTRMQTDISFYVDPNSFETLTKQSIPAMKLVTDIGQWIQAINFLLRGEDEISSGVNAGESRMFRETLQLVPIPVLSQGYRIIQSSEQVFDD